jgi:hypothetical protein
VSFTVALSWGANNFLHLERTIDGSGTIDLGDLELDKRSK